MTRHPSCSDWPIWNVWLAAFHAPSLAVADELGVFTALRDRSLTSRELATVLGIELRAGEALLGLMAALGFLAKADARFHLTDVARDYLLPDSPYYWGALLQRIRTIPLDCNKLISGLRRGSAAREARISGELWGAPLPPPEALASFTHAMHAHSFSLAMRTVATFGLAGVTRLLDVAGGSGSTRSPPRSTIPRCVRRCSTCPWSATSHAIMPQSMALPIGSRRLRPTCSSTRGRPTSSACSSATSSTTGTTIAASCSQHAPMPHSPKAVASWCTSCYSPTTRPARSQRPLTRW